MYRGGSFTTNTFGCVDAVNWFERPVRCNCLLSKTTENQLLTVYKANETITAFHIPPEKKFIPARGKNIIIIYLFILNWAVFHLCCFSAQEYFWLVGILGERGCLYLENSWPSCWHTRKKQDRGLPIPVPSFRAAETSVWAHELTETF